LKIKKRNDMKEDSEEVWKDVEGFAGYQVSSLGRFRCLSRVHKSTRHGKLVDVHNGQRFIPKRKKCGHMFVSMGGKSRMVHQLVLETFNGPMPKGHKARHMNGIKDDDRISNLSWVLIPADKAENLEGEEWKDITGFSGYQISSLGRVRSIDRHVASRVSNRPFTILKKGRILQIKYSGINSRCVTLFVDGTPNILLIRDLMKDHWEQSKLK